MERALWAKSPGYGKVLLTPLGWGLASRAPHLELVICSFFRQVSGAWISELGDRVLLRGSQYYPSLPAPSPSPGPESQTSFFTISPHLLFSPEEIVAGSP